MRLAYADPPYLGSTRNDANSRYGVEMRTGAEHRALAAALADCCAAVVLSGYDSPLYAELYAGWHRYEIATMTGNGRGEKARTEVLWSNRALGEPDLFTTDGRPTGEAIRKAVRTSAANGRMLRDTLRAERSSDGGTDAEAAA